jgi:hypothetical protein
VIVAAPVPPVAALTASPAHVTLAGAGHAVIRVTNTGARAVVVDAARAGFSLGPRGRPRVAPAAEATAWHALGPRRVVLAPHASAAVQVSVKPPVDAPPGDHAALVLLTTQAAAPGSVGVRVRIGVTVVVRIAGRVLHRLAVSSVRARRGVVGVVLANRGNVVERKRVEVALVSHGTVVARLRSGVRELLPHSSAIVELRYRGAARGRVTARVSLGARARPRNFRVRL